VLWLTIGDDRPAPAAEASPDYDLHLLALHERVTLSGGTFDPAAPNGRGASVLRAAWPA